jgi:hypothetical protein
MEMTVNKQKNMSEEPLFQEPTVSFRAIKRKGEFRYIASLKRGSLSSIARFAPPTKIIPKIILKLASLIDFRISAKFNWVISISVSKDFLLQVADLLETSFENVGFYVGESTPQQKLVAADITGESNFVLKIARGAEADESIRREANGIKNALSDGYSWPLGIPSTPNIKPICGRDAILIERIQGSQLTPKEFENLFFDEFNLFIPQDFCYTKSCDDILHKKSDKANDKPRTNITIGEWLESTTIYNAESLVSIIETCRQNGALEILSPLGIVHGDFAPWNVIKKEKTGKKSKVTKPMFKESLIAVDWEFSSKDKPVVFDIAYAVWCYETLLGRKSTKIKSTKWKQLVSLGALWEEIRKDG